MGSAAENAEDTRLIKRYANRKLYDTAERRFTSLGAIKDLVRSGIDVVVLDHSTGADRTEETLGQALGKRRKDAEEPDLGRGMLAELIRAPERLGRVLRSEQRDAAELRNLRDEVRELSRIIDSLLTKATQQQNRDERDAGNSSP